MMQSFTPSNPRIKTVTPETLIAAPVRSLTTEQRDLLVNRREIRNLDAALEANAKVKISFSHLTAKQMTAVRRWAEGNDVKIAATAVPSTGIETGSVNAAKLKGFVSTILAAMLPEQVQNLIAERFGFGTLQTHEFIDNGQKVRVIVGPQDQVLNTLNTRVKSFIQLAGTGFANYTGKPIAYAAYVPNGQFANARRDKNELSPGLLQQIRLVVESAYGPTLAFTHFDLANAYNGLVQFIGTKGAPKMRAKNFIQAFARCAFVNDTVSGAKNMQGIALVGPDQDRSLYALWNGEFAEIDCIPEGATRHAVIDGVLIQLSGKAPKSWQQLLPSDIRAYLMRETNRIAWNDGQKFDNPIVDISMAEINAHGVPYLVVTTAKGKGEAFIPVYLTWDGVTPEFTVATTKGFEVPDAEIGAIVRADETQLSLVQHNGGRAKGFLMLPTEHAPAELKEMVSEISGYGAPVAETQVATQAA